MKERAKELPKAATETQPSGYRLTEESEKDSRDAVGRANPEHAHRDQL